MNRIVTSAPSLFASLRLLGVAGMLLMSTLSAQITIFSENMGTPSSTTAIGSYTGWQNNGTLTFTGSADVRNTTVSTGYATASGTGNVFITNVVGTNFQISGINTLGYSVIQLSFGVFKSTTASNGSELVVEVSDDGTTYSPLSFTALPTGTGTATWYYRTASGSIPSTSNLRIRFRQTSTSPQFRIDDVLLTGASANTDFFRSRATGDWTAISTWESSNNGINWVEATLAPTSAANTITIRSPHTVTSTGALSIDQVTVNSGATLATNAVLSNSGNLNVSGTFRINQGGFAQNGTFVYSGNSTLVFNNTSGSYGVDNGHVYWPATNGPQNVTVQGSGGITLNDGTIRTVQGTFQTFAGVNKSGSGALTCEGDCEIRAGGFFLFSPTYGSASNLIYNTGGLYGRASEWSDDNNSSPGLPQNVIIRNGTILNYPNGVNQPRFINGNLTIEASSALYMDYASQTISTPLRVGGQVFLFGGALSLGISAGGDIYVGGNWKNTGGTFAPNNRAVIFDGASGNQTITGQTTFDFFFVDKAAGKLVLADNITCNQAVALTNGVVDARTNDKTFAANAAVNRTNGYVDGKLQRRVADGNNSFPTGTATVYAPVTLNMTGVSGAVDITGLLTSGVHPNEGTSPVDPAKKSNHYWSLSKSGAGTFTSYTGAFDVNNTANTGTVANYKIAKFDSPSSWSAPGGSAAGNVVTSASFTTFSDFIAGEAAPAPADYDITTTPTSILITDVAGNGETLDVSENGTSIRFNAAGRTFSLNGGAATAMPADVALSGINSITVDAADGNDIINIGIFSPNVMPSLTINGGTGDDAVNLNGDISFAANANLDVDLQDDHASPGVDDVLFGPNANVVLSGSGIAKVMASRIVKLEDFSSLETENGNLTIEANQQASPTSGNFVGITLDSAMVRINGTGNGTLKGKGGTSASAFGQYGVELKPRSSIIGGLAGSSMTITGTGGTGTTFVNIGVELSGFGVTKPAQVTSLGGNVSVIGQGGSSVQSWGVHVGANASISAGGNGSVNVQGAGGAGTGNENHGVYVAGANARITTTNGNLSVTGTGGGALATNKNYGVYVVSNGEISAGGAGTVNINGTGGATNGGSNHGVFAWGQKITSAGGNVSVTGIGGSAGGGSNNVGVAVYQLGEISAGGSGTVTVQGTGSAAGVTGNHGVYVWALLSTSTTQITSAGGNVSVTGQGGSTGANSNCHGVYVGLGGRITSAGSSATVSVQGTAAGTASSSDNYGVLVSGANALVSSGGGAVSVTGIEGVGANSVGISMLTSGAVTTATNGGNISLIANSIDLQNTSAVSTNAGSSTTLRPYTNSVQIDLGSTANPIGGPLSLSDTELDLVSTGTLIIGNSTSGNLTVTAAIGRPAPTAVQLRSGADVIFNQNFDTNGGTLLLDPGASPAAVKPTFSGTDATASTVSFASDLAIVINGMAAGDGTGGSYTQLTVIGAVDLTGVDLVLSGTHTPAIGQSFVIVNNDGSDAVINTFNGLLQGAIINNFLGSVLNAQISYTGGDGNDVVLTVLASVEIDVQGNGVSISDGDNSPTASDHTDFGTVAVNASFQRTFTILNTGSGNLNVSGISSDNALFTIGALTPASPIAGPNGSATFTITFNPNAAGIHNATISIQNDDADEGVYTFSVTGYAPLPVTTIGFTCVSGTIGNYYNGGAGPNVGVAFQVGQAGGGRLNAAPVIDPVVNIPAGFTTAFALNADVAVGYSINVYDGLNGTGTLLASKGDCPSSGNCFLTFSGVARSVTLGRYSSGVNGYDNLTFGSTTIGTPVSESDKEIDVRGNLISIPDGDTSPDPADGTNFGLAGVGNPVVRTFYVHNDGTAPLNVSSILSSNILFVVSGLNPASPIPANASATFTVTFTPVGIGAQVATITLNNDDCNESVYDFSVSGTGTNIDYSISTTGGNLVITDLSGNGDVLSMSPSGADAIFNTSPARTYSLNGGPATAFPVTINNIATFSNIEINQAAGNDQFDIGLFSGIQNLTINGGTGDDVVNFNDDITFAANANLNVDLQNDDPTPGVDRVVVAANANLLLSGTGAATVRVSRNVTLNSGGSLVTENGNLTVEANQQTTATGGNFIGIDLNNGLIQATGTGAVSVFGRGGNDAGGQQRGVFMHGGGDIIGGTSGQLTVNGTGGASPGNANRGVYINDPGSTITSNGASVSVTGNGGGSGLSGTNYGVQVALSAVISAGGSGSVTIQGTGGSVSGNGNTGVYVNFNNATITSNNGNVQVTGTGGGSGASGANSGVHIVAASTISAGGSGSVTIMGIGGTSSGDDNRAIYLQAGGPLITSGGGNVHVTGTEGGGSSGLAVLIESEGTISTATNGGTVTLIGNSMSFSGSAIVSANTTSSVTLRQRSNGTLINLGGADVLSGSPLSLGLTDAELDRVTAGTLILGDANSGLVTITSAISRPAPTNVELRSGADVNFNQNFNTNGGTLLLAPGASPAAVKPTFSGTDATASTVSFNSDLAIVINGTSPGDGTGSTYTQLTVTGAVDLTGVDLVLSGTHTPAIGQSFVIVNNDGVDPVTGIFNGLPEDFIIENFLVSGAFAQISYTGGDGNDVVLTVVSCFTSSAAATAYNDGWQATDNDNPAGFSAWSFQLGSSGNPAVNGHFVGTSANNGNGDSNNDGDINTGGRAWGLYANSGASASARRSLLTPMVPGSSISYRIDNGNIQTGGNIAVSLRNAGDQTLQSLSFVGGASNYVLNDGSGSNVSTGIPFTDEGLEVEITVTAPGIYSITITPLGGGSPVTLSGRAFNALADQVPAGIGFFNTNAGTGAASDFFVNGLRVCYPPCPGYTAVLSGSTSVCAGGSGANLSVAIANNNNGPFALNIDTDGVPATIELQVPNYTSGANIPVSPSATTTYTLVSVTDALNCEATVSGSATVTVVQPQTPNAGQNQQICITPGTATLAATAPTSGTGAWSVTSGPSTSSAQFANTANAGTTFTPAGGAGIYTLRWTITNAPCPVVSAQVQITVEALPTATAGGSQTICQGGTTLALGAAKSPAAATGAWSDGAVGGIFSGNSDPNATYTPPAAFTGPVTLTWTVSSATCNTSVSTSQQVLVQAPPDATAGGNQTICQGGTSAPLGGNTPGANETGQWSDGGAGGVFSPNANAPNATYAPPAAFFGPLTLTWTLSSTVGCGTDADPLTLSVTQTPTADAGTVGALCSSTGSVQLNASLGGSATSGTWSNPGGDGYFNNNAISNATYVLGTNDIANASVTLIWTSNDPDGPGVGCDPAADQLIVQIDPAATVEAGTSQTICRTKSLMLSALNASIGGGASSATWSTNGDGSFVNAANQPSNVFGQAVRYLPGPQDIANGTVILTLSTNDPPGPCDAASDTVTLSILPVDCGQFPWNGN